MLPVGKRCDGCFPHGPLYRMEDSAEYLLDGRGIIPSRAETQQG